MRAMGRTAMESTSIRPTKRKSPPIRINMMPLNFPPLGAKICLMKLTGPISVSDQ